MQNDFEAIDKPRLPGRVPGPGGKRFCGWSCPPAGLKNRQPIRALMVFPSRHSSLGFINLVSLAGIRENSGI
ncbi:protein of unknown function [Methanoculleus bourgensis]|uniref:Uncharacterized protein n=1 Tax=Methanoculleus bourgensis TaxID=83986 RepID=A0A110BKC5_9EURY|nr:protein of unknown function [Methanoculleus bourgensis]